MSYGVKCEEFRIEDRYWQSNCYGAVSAEHLGITKPTNTKNMKLKSSSNPILKSAIALTACAGLNALAGPAPVSKTVVPEVKPLFTGAIEAGWDSRYYFRGLWFADNITWAGVNLSVPLADKLTLGVGALFTSTVDTRVNNTFLDENLDYSELDLSVSLAYEFQFAKVAVVFTNYQFFDGFSGTTSSGFGPATAFGQGEFNNRSVPELGMVVSKAIGPVNVYGAYYYDFNIGGSYIEAGVDYTFKANNWLSIVPSVKGGYGMDYYSHGAPGALANGVLPNGPGVTSGFTHLLLSCSAPITITKNAVLSPYVAYNISGRSRQANNLTANECFGGVKLSVTF